MRKCFEGVRCLEFGEGGSEVVALVSGEGERIALAKPVKARGGVEAWLGGVEAAMGASLRRLCHAAMHAYSAQVPAAPAARWQPDCTQAVLAAQPAQSLLALSKKYRRACPLRDALTTVGWSACRVRCAGAHRVDGGPAGTAGAGDLTDDLVR